MGHTPHLYKHRYSGHASRPLRLGHYLPRPDSSPSNPLCYPPPLLSVRLLSLGNILFFSSFRVDKGGIKREARWKRLKSIESGIACFCSKNLFDLFIWNNFSWPWWWFKKNWIRNESGELSIVYWFVKRIIKWPDKVFLEIWWKSFIKILVDFHKTGKSAQRQIINKFISWFLWKI